MNNRKGFLIKIIVLCLLLTIIVSVTACDEKGAFGDDLPAVIEVESVELSQTELVMETGANATIEANVFPKNATNKSLKWESSDSSVATVSYGLVTAKSSGVAKITVSSSNGKTETCIVMVLQDGYENLFIVADNSIIGITEEGKKETVLIIPQSINGTAVEQIASSAFANSTGLKHVYVPDTITSIGIGAFEGCVSLESIMLPFIGASKEETDETSFGYIFGAQSYVNNNNYVPARLQSVTITNIINVKENAFYNCNLLTCINIPDGVESIDSYAFGKCGSLNSITIPEGVLSIGNNAFKDCKVLAIYCEIKDKPYDWVEGWNKDYCPVIWDCNNNDVANDGKIYYVAEDGIRYALKDGSVSVVRQAHSVNGSIELFSIVNYKDKSYKVTSIDESAFSDCSSVTSVTISDGVESIGKSAFSDCSSLTSVTIPDSVTSIGNLAFSGCTSLAEIKYNAVNAEDLTSYSRVFYNAGANTDGITVIFGENVNKIPGYLFYVKDSVYSPKITSVTIGNNVESIGKSAFSGCGTLASVTISDGVESIGKSAFSDCSSLTSVTIPDSVTSIGNLAFSGCTSLAEIKYNAVNAEDLTSYSRVFYNAGANTDGITVIFGENVNKIPGYLFYVKNSVYSPKITSVTIGNSVASIGDSAFNGCALITEIIYNAVNVSDLTDVSNVFYNAGINTDGIDVAFGEKIDRVPAYLFGVKDKACSPKIKVVSFADEVTSIGTDAFGGCVSIETVNIAGIEEWCNISFDSSFSNPLYYSKKLYLNGELVTNVEIPESITTIGDYLFEGGSSFNSVKIPDEVICIGDSAFSECDSLTNIVIPDKVTSIGSKAFRGCSSLKSITFGKGSRLSILGDFGVFAGCTSLTDIVMPDGLENIGSYAFNYCIALEEIAIPKGVKSIGDSAFRNTPIKEITIPEGVRSIGNRAFENCYSLEKVVFDENSNIESIGDMAFQNCDILTSITIPAGVTHVGMLIFGFSMSATVYCEIESQPEGWDSDWCSSDLMVYKYPVVWDCKNQDIADDGNIYYVDESRIRYTIKDGEATVAIQARIDSENIEIPSSIAYKGNVYSVTSIGMYAFEGCSGFTSITIPDGVTSIGNYAFEYCSSVTSITIPDSITTIGSSAFYGCSSLTIYCEVASKPSGWDSNWNYGNCPVIWDCNNNEVAEDGAIYYIAENGIRYALKDGNATVVRQAQNLSGDMVIPSSVSYKDNVYNVTSIGSDAFYGCSSLTSITIPDGVTSIAFSAFYGCSSLTSITIPDSVTSIDEWAFYNCSSLKNVYYLGTQQQWSQIVIIGGNNSYLLNAKRYYYSESEPSLNEDGTAYDGNYWHYVDGVPTPWIKEA